MLTLRRMGAQDAADVARIHAASWRTAYRGILPDRYLDRESADERLGHWTARLAAAAPDERGIIVFEAAAPVGFSYAKLSASPAWGHLLDNLHVMPGYRGRGIGCSLLLALSGVLLRGGDGPMHLWVYDENVAARRFYSDLGAEPVHGEVVDTPGGGRARATVFLWPSLGALHATIERWATVTAGID
jgi:ribosomal protein S18 acetylase RimI-like enzyme